MWLTLALIAGLYLFTVALAQLVGGQVTALIVGPIAVSAAVQLGVNPSAVGVAVAMGCSAAFLTPIAHPVNVLMMGPGSYTFLVLSGLATGASWICYFRALQLGEAAKVQPIDKMSVVIVAIFSVVFLGEDLTILHWLGIALVAAGAGILAL